MTINSLFDMGQEVFYFGKDFKAHKARVISVQTRVFCDENGNEVQQSTYQVKPSDRKYYTNDALFMDMEELLENLKSQIEVVE